MGNGQNKSSSTSCCRRKKKKKEYSASFDEPPIELSPRHATKSSKTAFGDNDQQRTIPRTSEDDVNAETVNLSSEPSQGTLSVHVDRVAPSSADAPITRETVSGSAARPVNVAVGSELQSKAIPSVKKTETASEPEVPLTSLDTAGPSSKSSLGGGCTTLKTGDGHSQDSPRRISRKKKQGQTRLKQRRGESVICYSTRIILH